MLHRDQLATLLHTYLTGQPDVEQKRHMGAINYTTHDKVFTFVGKSGLVLKLPQGRIDALEAAGHASHLVMGKRVCKEWALLQPSSAEDFHRQAYLLVEARTFVASETTVTPKGPARQSLAAKKSTKAKSPSARKASPAP